MLWSIWFSKYKTHRQQSGCYRVPKAPHPCLRGRRPALRVLSNVQVEFGGWILGCQVIICDGEVAEDRYRVTRWCWSWSWSWLEWLLSRKLVDRLGFLSHRNRLRHRRAKAFGRAWMSTSVPKMNDLCTTMEFEDGIKVTEFTPFFNWEFFLTPRVCNKNQHSESSFNKWAFSVCSSKLFAFSFHRERVHTKYSRQTSLLEIGNSKDKSWIHDRSWLLLFVHPQPALRRPLRSHENLEGHQSKWWKNHHNFLLRATSGYSLWL